MIHYKIRLQSGKILSELQFEGVTKLIRAGEISKYDEISEEGAENWLEVGSHKTFMVQFNDTRDETFIANIKNIDLSKPPIETTKKIDKPVEHFEEFPFEYKDTNVPKKAGENKASSSKIAKDKKESRSDKNKDLGQTSDVSDEMEETKINKEYKKYLDDEKKKKAEAEAEAEAENLNLESEVELVEVKTDYENDATQAISLAEIKADFKKAIETEKKFETQKKEKEINQKFKKNKLKTNDKNDDDFETNNEGKRNVIVAIIAFLVVMIFLFDSKDDETKKGEINLIDPIIQFPTKYDTEDETKANLLYKKGLEELRKSKYISQLNAANYFLQSVENKFTDNPAMAKLIYTYALILKNSKEQNIDANSIFKLVQIFGNRAYTDPNFASAISLFYYSINKNNAALKVFDKYHTLNKKNATLELFAVRLMALTKGGFLVKAEKIAKRLSQESNKGLLTIKALFEFYKLQGEPNKMKSLLKEGLSVYPNAAFLLIEVGMLAVETGNYAKIPNILENLNLIGMENSKYVYSRYLILAGMYHASKKDVVTATKYFEKSLKLFESIELIEKLSLLGGANNLDTDKLITTSRARKFLIKAKLELKRNDLKAAFKQALLASNEAPELIEVRLFLAELQLKRGYINDAIVQLESLYRDNSSSLDILFGLIDAYTEAYKFKKVRTLLGAARSLSNQDEDRFSSAQAKYSLYRGDYFSGSGWLQRAINANPLNNDNIYELAKLYLRFHEYDKGKSVLKRAMILDPINVDYRISYAKILYEVENSAAAIGYLFDVLDDFPDDPSIYGAIGIYYYRSGQIKKYEDIKKKLLTLPNRDVSLYKFLIETARLDDNKDKMIIYSEKLIDADPGNLKVRMNVAAIYIKRQQYKKAKKQLDAVEVRLDSYPKLQFLKAKLYYLIDDLEQAKILAKKEIQKNPTIVDGYILLADINLKENELNKAKKLFVKAIKVEPKNVDAILGIAYISIRNDQYDMALDQYQKAIKSDPNRQEVYRLLGDAYRKLGQSQSAIKNYKHFLELSPNSKYKNSITNYIKTMK